MFRRASLVALSFLLCGGALAQPKAPTSDPTMAGLRPSGPVTVKADHAEWVQDSTMKYSGHVSLQSDTLNMVGDSMDVKQLPDGNFEAVIRGAPAVLDHLAQPDSSGPAALPVHAEAQQLEYGSASGTVTLTGAAHLKRGSDEVHGANIGYEVEQRRVRASGNDQGQVTIIFTPPPPQQGQQGEPGKSATGPSEAGKPPAKPAEPAATLPPGPSP